MKQNNLYIPIPKMPRPDYFDDIFLYVLLMKYVRLVNSTNQRTLIWYKPIDILNNDIRGDVRDPKICISFLYTPHHAWETVIGLLTYTHVSKKSSAKTTQRIFQEKES